MITSKWRGRGGGAQIAGRTLVDASEGFAAALRQANHALARGRRSGVRRARAIGDSVLDGTQRVGRSTQELLTDYPVQTVLVIGIAGFALGWVARRARELHAGHTPRVTTESAPRTRSQRRKRTS